MNLKNTLSTSDSVDENRGKNLRACDKFGVEKEENTSAFPMETYYFIGSDELHTDQKVFADIGTRNNFLGLAL